MKNIKNIKVKKITALAIALVFAAGLLSGCGGKSEEEGELIKVGASPSPHAAILKAIAPELKKEGYKLEVVEFEDYVKPNQALTDNDIDANYFQHKPYLDDYNNKNKTDIASAGAVHFEPLGIYKGAKKSLDKLANGDKVGVPNDTTNEARALLLLQDKGLIKLNDKAGLQATKKDIVENPKNIDIVELEAAVIPKSLPDLAVAVINGNYAISAGLKTEDSIAFESKDSEAAKEYANILAVRAEDKDSDKTKALVKALCSDTAKKFINDKYSGAVVPVF